MYYGAVHRLAEQVIRYVRRHDLALPGNRIGVAVSGGADSVALLRLFLELRAELGVVLSVVHLNHKLRGAESDADEKFVRQIAAENQLECHCESSDVAADSAAERLSLETAAREARYGFFRRLLLERGLDRIATAHTLDDQAETVLLRIVRGAGTRGLAGIYPQLSVSCSQFSDRPRCASIVRPLLAIRRKELEAYLIAQGQSWREDSSNRDLRHARNRVRHGILPRLARNLNPAVREALSELAEIARAEEQYWSREVDRSLQQCGATDTHLGESGARRLKLAALLELPLALQRRVIRAAAQALNLRLEFRHVEELLEIVGRNSGTAVLPNSSMASIETGRLVFRPAPRASSPVCDYEYRVPIPGRVSIPETGMVLEASVVSLTCNERYSRETLLALAAVPGDLTVRNWRPGDRFWPAHTKAQKKVKELLQEKHLSDAERKLWPVLLSAGEIIWVRGFPPPARLQAREDEKQALLIREVPLSARPEPMT
jgi:tRNA(Ile)-lysidine synthase